MILKERLSSKEIIGIFIIGFWGAFPVLLKILSLPHTLSLFTDVTVSTQEYILAMYRDEIDDFSAIYQILIHPKLLLMKLIFCLSPLALLALLGKKVVNYKYLIRLTPLIVLPFVFFFATALVEIIYQKYNILETVMEKIINSQVGCRVIKYAGLPAVFIWFSLFLYYIQIAKKYTWFGFNLRNTTTVLDFIIYFSLVFFALIFIKTTDLKNTSNFIRLLSDRNTTENFMSQGRGVYYKKLLNAGYNYHRVNQQYLYDCQVGTIYEETPPALILEKSDLFYKNTNLKSLGLENIKFKRRYDDLKNRQDIISLIKLNIPIGVGIITPPYFNCFREFLPNYDIYLQEHDDGNFMLGSKIIYEHFKQRMDRLNINYLNLPTQSSGLNVDTIRRNWLNLDQSNFLNIKGKEPSFAYVLTEATHKLDFNIVSHNDLWVLYQIK